jgi:hypothetical protein
MGLPQIDEPTQADIDKYHSQYVTCDVRYYTVRSVATTNQSPPPCRYVSEIQRIFNTYKQFAPEYVAKTLELE